MVAYLLSKHTFYPLLLSFTLLLLSPSTPPHQMQFSFHFFPLFLKKNRLHYISFHLLLFTFPLLFTLALLILPGDLIDPLFVGSSGKLPGMCTEPGNALPAARGGEGGAGVSSPLCKFTEFAVRAGAGAGQPLSDRPRAGPLHDMTLWHVTAPAGLAPGSLGRAATSGPGRRSVLTVNNLMAVPAKVLGTLSSHIRHMMRLLSSISVATIGT